MTAGRSDRGLVRIRRRGRHSTPSQIEKVAQQAGKAAPAVAIAGALVAAPQASHALAASAKPVTATAQSHATAAAASAANTSAANTSPASTSAAGTGAHTATATLDSFATRTVTVTVAAANSARHAAAAQSTYYSVRSGDTLAKVADRYYHNANDWQYLYHENERTVSDPNLIYAGERLFIPATAPANYTLTSYVPKHAKPAQPAARTVSETSQRRDIHSSDTHATIGGATDGGAVIAQSAAQGTYGCSGLEQIWEHGSLATLNAFQNARSAIALSDNGTNWGPWTTYYSGAYSGKC